MKVAWQASFKKDDTQWDGLAPYVEDFVKDPMPPRYALVRLEVVEVKNRPQEGTQQPKVAVRHVELVTDPSEVLRVGSRMQALYAQRTGRDDYQPGLFDDDTDAKQREADADEGEEILAERAEASAEQATDRAEEEAIRANEPWPGDVEFTSPEEASGGNAADEAESSQVKRSARKPRR